SLLICYLFLTTLRPPRLLLFPYTTLFRSRMLLFSKDPPAVRFTHQSSPMKVHAAARACEGFGQRDIGPVIDVDHVFDHGSDVAQIGRAPSELQSRGHLVCRLLLEKKKKNN